MLKEPAHVHLSDCGSAQADREAVVDIEIELDYGQEAALVTSDAVAPIPDRNTSFTVTIDNLGASIERLLKEDVIHAVLGTRPLHFVDRPRARIRFKVVPGRRESVNDIGGRIDSGRCCAGEQQREACYGRQDDAPHVLRTGRVGTVPKLSMLSPSVEDETPIITSTWVWPNTYSMA